jgi:hypothetical protein
MKKMILLSVIAIAAAALAGCHSTCRPTTSGWFNRGDRCNECPPADCPPGVPRTQMMIPSTPTTVLPGAIEVAPAN